jgi:hypothetical protein
MGCVLRSENRRDVIRASGQHWATKMITTSAFEVLWAAAQRSACTNRAFANSDSPKEHFEFAVERGLIPPGEDKAFVQWRRPPAPDTGAELVVVLVFPTDFLRSDAPTVTVKKPLVIFEAAAQARAVEIGFFYSREAGITLEPKLLEFGKPLFWTELDNGETVWMVSRDADFDPSVLPSTEEINSGAERLLNPDAFAEVSVEERGLTGAFWTPPKDGEALRVIEIGGISMKRNK